MDIFDLPILPLCDQYLAYLDAMDVLDLNAAGDFLVMAATLLEIKSRLLLPAPPRDPDADLEDGGAPEDPRAELVRRLLEYGKYQAISEALRGAEGERRDLFFRSPGDAGNANAALPPRFGEMSADALLHALERMLSAVGAGERAVTSVRRQKITLRMKMRDVQYRAQRAGAGGVLLTDLLPSPPFALLEVVLVFLALLELLKSGTVTVAQDIYCGDIWIFDVSDADRAAREERGEGGGDGDAMGGKEGADSENDEA